MTIPVGVVDALRSALFAGDEEAAGSAEALRQEDLRPFGCLLIAAIAEGVERTLGGAPQDRSDYVRVVSQARVGGDAMDLDPMAAERVIRMIYGDESVPVARVDGSVEGVQLILARAFAQALDLGPRSEQTYMSLVRARAQQILSAMP